LAPEVRLGEIEKLWTDEINTERAWKGFVPKLLEEWHELNLLVCWHHIQTRILEPESTVMLLANVGFLAIPRVVIFNLNSSKYYEL